MSQTENNLSGIELATLSLSTLPFLFTDCGNAHVEPRSERSVSQGTKSENQLLKLGNSVTPAQETGNSLQMTSLTLAQWTSTSLRQ